MIMLSVLQWGLKWGSLTPWKHSICFPLRYPSDGSRVGCEIRVTPCDKKRAFIFLINTVITGLFVFHCGVSRSPEEIKRLVCFRINKYIWWIERSSISYLEIFFLLLLLLLFNPNKSHDLWCGITASQNVFIHSEASSSHLSSFLKYYQYNWYACKQKFTFNTQNVLIINALWLFSLCFADSTLMNNT